MDCDACAEGLEERKKNAQWHVPETVSEPCPHNLGSTRREDRAECLKVEDIAVKHARFLTRIAVLVLAGCAGRNENPSNVAVGPGKPAGVQGSKSAVISGRVTVSFVGDDRVVELHDVEGGVYRVIGSKTGALASVAEGDVVARGTFDARPGFSVEEFQVIGMHGRQALDGVLEMTPGGFGLRLANGSLREVPGLTVRCAEYLGLRVWLVGWEEFDLSFGVIAVS